MDTGLDTMTGGRLKRIKDYLDNDAFLMTYGDGVSDVNIAKLVDFHNHHNGIVTMTVIHPESRYGNIDLDGDYAKEFREKSISDSGWINAGFMVVKPEALDYIEGDSTVFERSPLERIAASGKLSCYKHDGFWHCMDTLRDKKALDQLIESGDAPWMIWK